MKLTQEVKDQLFDLQKKNIYLEGNILKVIDTSDDPAFEKYIKAAIEKDRDIRKRRLDITKQVQSQNRTLVDKEKENESLMNEIRDALKNTEDSKIQIENQNKELLLWKKDNERMSEELNIAVIKSEEARAAAEKAKDHAENDLDLLQKKSQTELIGTIVKVALLVILSVGVITTIMYSIAMFTGKDTQIIGSTWSNMFGILLTNAFSIVGTIMGVKYASESNKQSE
jgi:predicted transcriptional regulator